MIGLGRPRKGNVDVIDAVEVALGLAVMYYVAPLRHVSFCHRTDRQYLE